MTASRNSGVWIKTGLNTSQSRLQSGDYRFRNQRESQSRGGAHSAVLLVADFSQVHPSDHAQSRRQTLQQQADDGGAQQHPEELRGRAHR